MHDHDADGTDGGRNGQPSEQHLSEVTGPELRATGDRSPPRENVPSTRRRSLLKAMSITPVAAVLAGCSLDDVEFEAGTATADGTLEDVEVGETVALGAAVEFDESYELTVTTGSEDGRPTTTVRGRVHQKNQYVRTERDGTVSESYLVDGEAYTVTGDQCFKYPLEQGESATGGDGNSATATEGENADTTAATGGENGSDTPVTEVKVVETTTLDGAEVYRLEGTIERGDTVVNPSYYVHSESEHLRRVEIASTVVEYTGWGETEPITPPDVECRTYETPGSQALPSDATAEDTHSGGPTPDSPTPTPTETTTEWEVFRQQEYRVEEQRGTQVSVEEPSTMLVTFATATDFDVDIYTLPVAEVVAFFEGEAEASYVEELSFTGSQRGEGRATVEEGDYAVIIENTAEFGDAAPPEDGAVAVVSLTVGVR